MSARNAAQVLLDKRKKQQKSKYGSDYLWFSLPKDECEVVLRFYPAGPTEDLPGRLEYKHFGIPHFEDEDKTMGFKSLDGVVDEDPFEDVLSKYRDLINVKDYEKLACSYFVIGVESVKVKGKLVQFDEGGVEYNSKAPRILRTWGEPFYFWLLEQIVDEENPDITDLNLGVRFKFTRKPKAKGQSYGKIERKVLMKTKPLTDGDSDEMEAILAKSPKLSEVFKAIDDDYVVKATEGAQRLEKVFAEIYDEKVSKDNKVSKTLAAVGEISELDTDKSIKKKALTEDEELENLED